MKSMESPTLTRFHSLLLRKRVSSCGFSAPLAPLIDTGEGGGLLDSFFLEINILGQLLTLQQSNIMSNAFLMSWSTILQQMTNSPQGYCMCWRLCTQGNTVPLSYQYYMNLFGCIQHAYPWHLLSNVCPYTTLTPGHSPIHGNRDS